MTIDERIMFLVQSTESLHQTAQELTATIALNSEMIKRNSENIQRLSVIAGVHDETIEDLEARLDRLERKHRGETE
jgi:ubiquinone biosynthesis protein UbiJ